MTFLIETPRASVGAIAVTGDWDTVWLHDQAIGDWALGDLDGSADAGALRCRAGLASEVIRALFSDERASDGWRQTERDRRGWWGDGLGDQPLGGRLWTVIENGTAREADARAAEREARRALDYLITDRIAARLEVAAGVVPTRNALWLSVRLYGRDGVAIHDQRFEYLWRQPTPPPVPARQGDDINLIIDGEGYMLLANPYDPLAWG